MPSGGNASNDLDCDGKVEVQGWMVSTERNVLNLCQYTRNGQVPQEWLDWWGKGRSNSDHTPEVPCSANAEDVITARYFTMGAQKIPIEAPCAVAVVDPKTQAGTPISYPAYQQCREERGRLLCANQRRDPRNP